MQDQVEPRHTPERWPKSFAMGYAAIALLIFVGVPGGIIFWVLSAVSK